MARCMRNGHTASEAWAMTPRQLAAWSQIYRHEDTARDRTLLTLQRVAQHADSRGYKEFIKKMEKDI